MTTHHPLHTAGLFCKPDRSDDSSQGRLVKPPSINEFLFWLFTAYFTIIKRKESNFGGFLKNPQAHGLVLRHFVKHFLKLCTRGGTRQVHTRREHLSRPRLQDVVGSAPVMYLLEAELRRGEAHTMIRGSNPAGKTETFITDSNTRHMVPSDRWKAL